MDLFISTAIIILAVVFSNIIAQFFPKISNTYFNLFLGIIFGFIPLMNELVLPFHSEIFMILILAPVLFFEGQKTPMLLVKQKIKSIFGTAVILAVISAILSTIILPSIFEITLPLALLVVALSTPTDATAFDSVIGGRIVDEKVETTLKLESLFNDATGIVLMTSGVSWLTTGKFSLETNALFFLRSAIGGYPKGRLIELFGAESSGKTTVALQAVAETQKSGGYVAYIDAENSLDIEYAENLGVKSESLIFAQPDTGEEAFYMINEFVKTGAFDLIVVDSVAALTPASEIDGVSIPGQQAKMMSEQLSKLVSKVNQTKTVIIFINQVRSTMSGLFLNKETTPGGSALKFYSSVRIEVKSGEKIKDGIDTIGKKTTLHTVKNKVSAPYKKPSVINVFGDGFSQEIDVVTLAIQMGVVTKMNEWYSFNGQKLGRGIFSVKEYLASHQSVFEALKNLTRESLQFF